MPGAAEAVAQHVLGACFTPAQKEQPRAPAFLSLALAKALVLLSELIQLKNNPGKLAGFLLTGSVLIGLHQPGRGQGTRGGRILPSSSSTC